MSESAPGSSAAAAAAAAAGEENGAADPRPAAADPPTSSSSSSSSSSSIGEVVAPTVYGSTYTTPSSYPAAAAAGAAATAAASAAVLQPSAAVPKNATVVRGCSFSSFPSLLQLTASLLPTGLQATQLGRAIEVVEAMLDWRPPTQQQQQQQQQQRRQRRQRKQQIRQLLAQHNLLRARSSSSPAASFSSSSDLSSSSSSSSSSDEDPPPEPQQQQQQQQQQRCAIWVSFTSNMMSSGVRESLVFLARHKLIAAAVTSGGGIEEDIIKCFGPTLVGSFLLRGPRLRRRGWNRIGNLILPNENYCKFEDWLQPQLDLLLQQQQQRLAAALERCRSSSSSSKALTSSSSSSSRNSSSKDKEETSSSSSKPQQQQQQQQQQQELPCLSEVTMTPSELARALGAALQQHPRREESFLYWCSRNSIPVFCPGITDGSLGDNLYFHHFRNPGLVIDVARDVAAANQLAASCCCSGLLLLGGGAPKHHAANAQLMRGGADFAVYLNSAADFDGSDSGARPDEARSWGKLRAAAAAAKVTADASITFPILVAATFAKRHFMEKGGGGA
ncbi:deoxyhypusine synthase, putative, partial [Eimeria necatrix]